MKAKLFIGAKVRALRESRGWKLETCARQVGVSISYLSQIEANQRPVTSRVLVALVEAFHVPAESLDAAEDQRLLADLREAVADAFPGAEQAPLSELRQVAEKSPAFAHRYLQLHRAYRRLDERLKLVEEAVALDEAAAASALLPYEEVRDYFHYRDNYVHAVDTAAEELAPACLPADGAMLEAALEDYLRRELNIGVARQVTGDVLRRYDAGSRTLVLNTAQPPESRCFQIAYQIATEQLGAVIEAELGVARLRSAAAMGICRISLTNYAAGALLLPYERFRRNAAALRHDIDALAVRHQTSFEQTCHRLSTLQRPGSRGVPFYFLRVDRAGNITKRHSATRFQFARFGGTCPLWNVHDAIGGERGPFVQLAEMPDGVRYVCLAWGVEKRSGSFAAGSRKYALGLGCETRYADALIYADGLDLKAAPTPIGVSCRICERETCRQRAFPPIDRVFTVPSAERAVVPFSLAASGAEEP
jgi:XRE family transcriptional regulator, fatty acid utilization regulator